MPRIETNETLDVRGTLNLNAAASLLLKDNSIARSKIVRNDLAAFGVRLDSVKTWDDLTASLPGTAAADDLGLIEGTFGTDSPRLQTGDAAAASVTQRGRFQFTLPAGYIDGETITVLLTCGMEVVSDTTATVDVECYAYAGDGTAGSDICATSATTMNSATHADKSFTVTPTGLTSGDVLDIRLTVAITDGATGSGVVGEIVKVAVLCDIR